MQAIVSGPIPPHFDVVPKTLEEWVALQEAYNDSVVQALPGQEQRLHVTVEESRMAGATVYTVTPDQVAPENRDRLLIHIHGGCYVLRRGLAAATAAATMARIGHSKGTSGDHALPRPAPTSPPT